jgi:hypothetical protein
MSYGSYATPPSKKKPENNFNQKIPQCGIKSESEEILFSEITAKSTKYILSW